MKNLTLTSDQEFAVADIKRWASLNIYKNQDDAFYTLYGSAGTGKSTVTLDIIKVLPGTVCASAPTHKAKEVIGEITGLEALTLHSLLGLRPNVDLADYDPNNPQYDTLVEEKITDFDTIIVDECSMINKMLYKKLKEKAVMYKKRILFVGDAKQLPPVNENISLVFTDVKNKTELKEIVRQGTTNPNQQLLADAVTDVVSKTSLIPVKFRTPTIETNLAPHTSKEQGFIITDSQEEFYSKLIELYSDSEAKVNMNFIKTLAYTNKAVEALNKFIKNRINPSEDNISEGDYLLGYATAVDSAGGVIVQNSADYYVYALNRSVNTISGVTYNFHVATVSKTGKTISILHPNSYNDFQSEIERLFDDAKNNRKWRPYYAFKDKFILMKDFYHRDRTDRWGKPERIAQKNIDLGYAMTTHKSQGSTYDNVAIVYSNFKYCKVDIDRKKLTYVALSRTRYLNLVYI